MPSNTGEKTSGKLMITQIRSTIGQSGKQRRTLRALGLRHHQQSVTQNDSPAIRGMIFQVRHLVEVTELEGGEE